VNTTALDPGALDPGTLTPNARRILDVASALFYARGIAAVGVDLIAQESGITKRTLYNRFGSKDVLVATYLLERDRRWRLVIADVLANPALTATERITAPFAALPAWMADNPRGCAFINALAELPDPTHPGHRVATEEKRWLLGLFSRLSAEAGIADPDALAARLLSLHEGSLAVHAVLPDVDCVGAAASAARDLVDTAPRAGSPLAMTRATATVSP